jgi:hypothetical protein
MLEVKKPRPVEDDPLTTLLLKPELGNQFTTVREVIIDIIFLSNCPDRTVNHYNVIRTNKLYRRFGYMD